MAWLFMTENTNQGSTEPFSSSSQPSVGNAAPPSTPLHQSSELETPHSTGYAQDSDTEMEYEPPMSSALLPGAPTTVDLLILTEYLNTQFKEAGKGGQPLTEQQRASMQKFLIHGGYSREDIKAGLLHAVEIVCKAKRAMQAAMNETTTSNQFNAGGDVNAGQEAEGLRPALTEAVIAWEDVDLEITKSLPTITFHRGILQAYDAVAGIKVALLELYKRQFAAKSKAEQDVEMDTGGTNDYDTSFKTRTGSAEGKDEDGMEVDSAYEA